MTAVIHVEDRYAKAFDDFVHSLPSEAIRLTPLEKNLNQEIANRIKSIKDKSLRTNPIDKLSSLRSKYV